MRAGILRHEIRFEQRTESQNSFGDITITWSTFATVRASIEPLSGREFLEARAINEQTMVKIRCYYLAGIDTDMRIVDTETSEVYDITAILNYKRMNVEFEIMAIIINDETA